MAAAGAVSRETKNFEKFTVLFNHEHPTVVAPRRPDSGVKAWHPATCARRNVECDVSRRRVPAGNKPARQPILVML